MRAGRQGVGSVAARAPWWPPIKIGGRSLAPYLYEREPAARPGRAPDQFADLEVPLHAEAAPAGR